MHRIALILTLALTACQTAPDVGTAPVPDDGTYRLTLLDGAAAPWPVTLRFGSQDQISGQAPCNLYFGTATRKGESIRFSQIGMTEMACLDEARMRGDAQFASLMAGMDRAVDAGQSLTLTGAGHVMVFTRSP